MRLETQITITNHNICNFYIGETKFIIMSVAVIVLCFYHKCWRVYIESSSNSNKHLISALSGMLSCSCPPVIDRSIDLLIQDPNWYKAKNSVGREGMIPENYVQKREGVKSGGKLSLMPWVHDLYSAFRPESDQKEDSSPAELWVMVVCVSLGLADGGFIV